MVGAGIANGFLIKSDQSVDDQESDQGRWWWTVGAAVVGEGQQLACCVLLPRGGGGPYKGVGGTHSPHASSLISTQLCTTSTYYLAASPNLKEETILQQIY